jgi:hypothetical protein
MPSSTQTEPSTAQQPAQSRNLTSTQGVKPSRTSMPPPFPPNQGFKVPPHTFSSATANHHMHQLLQLLDYQQRHIRAKETASLMQPPQPREEIGPASEEESTGGQNSLQCASAAHSPQRLGLADAEQSRLVDALQALIKVKQASSHLEPLMGRLSDGRQGNQNSAQLHQLQRVIPQLTPATLSSLVERLEAQKEAAFREHVSATFNEIYSH